MVKKRGFQVMASALAACLLVVTACSTTIVPSPTPIDGVALDGLSRVDVSPVDYDGLRIITATFGTVVDGRDVSLQRRTASGWERLASGAQDEFGEVEFQTNSESKDAVYRVVALEATVKGASLPSVTTAEAAAGEDWKRSLFSDFSGSTLPEKYWSNRSTGIYAGGGRQCSAPYASNVEMTNGKLLMSVTSETDSANIERAKAAGCDLKDFYRNAMISTEEKFTLRTGLVAVRLKFPQGQGMHGAVWLQSYSKSEIDFIESFGHGLGLTSVVHVDGTQYPKQDRYVNIEAAKDRNWWSKYHVCSVEWDNTSVTFRIDGQVTRRIDLMMPETQYFLVISMLSSDWEQSRFTDPVRDAPGVVPTQLPQTMSVDWVRVWTPA